MRVFSAKKNRKPSRRHRFLKTAVSVPVIAALCALFVFLPSERTAKSLPAESVSSSVSSQTVSAPVRARRADILAAKRQNSDVIGWLTVPGTDLDMAVVHTADNSYYLTHNLSKQSYWKGWPFLDYRNDAENLGRNSIIYGHNMGDGTLFGELKRYEDLSFLNAHPVIYFGTADADRYWKIFAVYVTDVNFYYIQTDFSSDADFTSLVSQMRAQSMFNTTVDVTAADKILTLSTCTYDFKNARFVIEARLMRSGESYAVNAASSNSSAASPHHKSSSSV